jgi:uncharacterized membrane protein YfcA
MDIQAILILVTIGLAAGMLSGLIGVGGGIIIVPALVYFLHYTQHQAQGTSLGVLTFPVVVFAFISYYKDGLTSGAPIDFRVIVIIALAFLAGGFFGGQIAIRVDQQVLKKVFAVILFYTAIKMLGWDTVIVKWFKSLA